MILRTVFGRLPPDVEPQAVFDARARLQRMAGHVKGLDSIIAGAFHGVRLDAGQEDS